MQVSAIQYQLAGSNKKTKTKNINSMNSIKDMTTDNFSTGKNHQVSFNGREEIGKALEGIGKGMTVGSATGIILATAGAATPVIVGIIVLGTIKGWLGRNK